MEEKKIAELKSRLVHQGADGKVVWRSVGSITIFCPRLQEAVVLDEGGYTFILPAEGNGGLPSASIILGKLDQVRESKFWNNVFYALVGFGLAVLAIRFAQLLSQIVGASS